MLSYCWAFKVNVNFGPEEDVVEGYINDHGELLSVQERGLTYGWDCYHPDDVRKRSNFQMWFFFFLENLYLSF